MSYAAAIDQLSAMTPELHTQPGQTRRKFSLTEIGALLAALGNPHHSFRSVLIAGTNGKGSTASTLAAILQASGLRTGMYTSPHLTRPNERIRIKNVEISDNAFARLYFRVHDAGQQLVLAQKLAQLPSFFETLTAMAFLHFADAAIDIAVLEVGMGGRLDATNIVDPLLSVITDISLDHTEWLGPTIAAIAREKAGILRPHGTLITLPQHPEANQVLGEVATELGVRGVSAVPYMPQTPSARGSAMPATSSAHGLAQSAYPVQVLGAEITVDSPLQGDHQHRNIALAIAAAVELASHHSLPITPASIEQGIHATQWPGRLEVIQLPSSKGSVATQLAPSQVVQVVLDVAHNPAGAWALRAALRSLFHLGEDDAPPAVLVFSCLRDKPVAEMAQILFPLFDHVVFAPIASARATPMADLLAAADTVGIPARAATSVAETLESIAQGVARATRQTPGNLESMQDAGLKGTGFSPYIQSPKEAGAKAPEGSASHLIVVAGSVYLVGEVRPLLLARSGSQPSAQQNPQLSTKA
jgi:dihydrofolate synthase/folylpolyglutamate synthase